VGVCNQVLLFPLYSICSQLVTLLKFIGACIQTPSIFNLTVSFKFLNFSFQICLLFVPEMAQWLRYRATNRKVAGSIPAGVSGFFIDIKSFRPHYGPGNDSDSNRNECQEHYLGVKAAGA